MGMDLIGVGFTVRTDRKCNLDAIDQAIDAIPDEKIQDASWIDAVDPSGGLGWNDEDGASFPTDVRDALKAGAREFDPAVQGHRMSIAYPIQGTALVFVWTGGDSWGDDPFEGFTELCWFVNLCGMADDVREAAGFVCGGLPGSRLVALYSGEGE